MKKSENASQKYYNMTNKEYFKMRYEKIRAELANPVKRKVMANNTNEFFIRIFRVFLLFGLSFVIIFPIFQKLSLSIRVPADIGNPQVVWIPTEFSGLNYRMAIIMLKYERAVFATLGISIGAMLCQLLVTSISGYSFARLKFKGSTIFFYAVLLILLIPPQALYVSRLTMFTTFRMRGKIWSILLVSFLGMGIKSSLFIFLFKQFFAGLPKELEESAQVDGAGIFRTFWSVMLPNARGIILSVGLFAFVWQWNDIYYARLLNLSSGTFPLLPIQLLNVTEYLASTIKLYNFERYVGEEVTKNPLFLGMMINTCALLVMLPLLILYLFVQKQFIEGVERSGITG